MDPLIPQNPLELACGHLATEAEQHRDPTYRACNAAAGQPCRWALRHDGFPNPSFHTERLEASLPRTTLDPEETTAFQHAVLASGIL